MRHVKQNVVFAKNFDMDINLIKKVVITNRNLLSSIDLVRRDVDLDDSINYVFTIDNFYDCNFYNFFTKQQ